MKNDEWVGGMNGMVEQKDRQYDDRLKARHENVLNQEKKKA